jgi:hypothetical protein
MHCLGSSEIQSMIEPCLSCTYFMSLYFWYTKLLKKSSSHLTMFADCIYLTYNSNVKPMVSQLSHVCSGEHPKMESLRERYLNANANDTSSKF